MPLLLRKARQRKPSHFGSYCQRSPAGISSTERASIGGSGGWIGIGQRSTAISAGRTGKMPVLGRIPARLELRRTFSFSHSALHRDVAEFGAIDRTTQQQSAPAHVAAPDKFGRELDSLAQNLEQDA